MSDYPEQEIRVWLRLKPEPLDDIAETEGEWWIGSLSLNKTNANYRVGHSHPLRPESRLFKQAFEFGQARGWAVIFRPIDPPPATHQTDVFVGWVPPERASDADRWIGFLNTEIAKRFSQPSRSALRRVCMFSEFGYDDAPSIATMRGTVNQAHKPEILRYLRSGKIKVLSPGIENDVFDNSKSADSQSILTDGTYAWPALIAYYVDCYDVGIPSEFEAHMQENAWKVPDNVDVTSVKLS